MSLALLFPGQGSQAVGMGKELASSSTAARRVFAEADEALGEPLSTLIFDGPAEGQRIRLATLGLLQFLSPTVQFLIGLLVYHELFDAGRFRAYALIWCGLILYSADTFWSQRHALRRRRVS